MRLRESQTNLLEDSTAERSVELNEIPFSMIDFYQDRQWNWIEERMVYKVFQKQEQQWEGASSG